MKLLNLLLIGILLSYSNFTNADNNQKREGYITSCKKDLNYLRTSLQENSATYANKSDKSFHTWLDKGYENTLELINDIDDESDCYYAMKYYIDGFDNAHISIRGKVALPEEKYPGILSIRKGYEHYILYKNNKLKHLSDINVGDPITLVNKMDIETYYQDFVKPFYANNESEIALKGASIYTLIIDGNKFKPIIYNITTKHGDNSIKTELKYTPLTGSALMSAKEERQPDFTKKFKVEKVSRGVWIRIPNFSPTPKEEEYYIKMLERLKNKLAKEDYILFDMRGNLGGASKWSRPIIRNLWGDEFISSLGEKHQYNTEWKKKLRVSPNNFEEFKTTYEEHANKAYLSLLKKGKDFFLKKWSIYQDQENLYTNEDSSTFHAKIYVLTDHFCRRTCWNFVKEITQMPNVVHIGQETALQGAYSSAKQALSPSGNFDFFYPMAINICSECDFRKSLVPSKIYEGNMKDEAKLTDWILSITEKDLYKSKK